MRETYREAVCVREREGWVGGVCEGVPFMEVLLAQMPTVQQSGYKIDNRRNIIPFWKILRVCYADIISSIWKWRTAQIECALGACLKMTVLPTLSELQIKTLSFITFARNELNVKKKTTFTLLQPRTICNYLHK